MSLWEEKGRRGGKQGNEVKGRDKGEVGIDQILYL